MNIPNFADLYNSILNDLKTRLGITFILGKVVLNAFAAVQAAKLKIIYTAIAYRYKNIFIDTADPSDDGGTLERFGLVKLGRQPYSAIAGEYTVEVNGNIGVLIPKETTYKSVEGSVSPDKLFILDSDFTFVSQTGTISLRALDLGSDARLEIGDSLQVTAPILNADSYATVKAVNVAPTDAENYEDYRQAVIDAYQLEAQGGAKTDYRLWSKDAAGVRQVYPYAKNNFLGEINLYVEAYAIDSIDGNGTPSTSMLNNVEAVVEFDPDTTKPLNERGRRPISAWKIHFLPITPLSVDVIITDLSDISVLNDIKNSMREFLLGIRPFIAGADNINSISKGKIYISDIFNVVRSVIGGTNSFTDIQMKVDGNFETIYEFLNGDIPYINTVTNV